jgi:hypothetical protein
MKVTKVNYQPESAGDFDRLVRSVRHDEPENSGNESRIFANFE